MILGLRVDVDTYRGTREGVPNLINLLGAHDVRATFFFCVGPDNMGRHLWRMLRPAFMQKMFRSRAAMLYGWDILFKGTFWPGPLIGERFGDTILATAQAGHEVGLHAWDHHAWQVRIERMAPEAIRSSISRGVEALGRILGRAPACSAAAGWKCTEQALLEKNRFGFLYNSDCRGRSIFRPLIEGTLCTPQIPVTLPTYDEVVGRCGITDSGYNDYILSLVKPDGLNVLTIHAEVEGIGCRKLFLAFLRAAQKRQIRLMPLGTLLPEADIVQAGTVCKSEIPGRQGWVSLQA